MDFKETFSAPSANQRTFEAETIEKSTYPHLVTGWQKLAASNIIFVTIINSHDLTDSKKLVIYYHI